MRPLLLMAFLGLGLVGSTMWTSTGKDSRNLSRTEVFPKNQDCQPELAALKVRFPSRQIANRGAEDPEPEPGTIGDQLSTARLSIPTEDFGIDRSRLLAQSGRVLHDERQHRERPHRPRRPFAASDIDHGSDDLHEPIPAGLCRSTAARPSQIQWHSTASRRLRLRSVLALPDREQLQFLVS